MPIFHLDLIDADSSIDDNYYRSGTRVYRVFAPLTMDESQVRAGLGIGIYALHPSDSGQLVRKISVKLDAKNRGGFQNPTDPTDVNNGTPCFVWIASVEYGPWNPLEHTATGAPQDQPVRVEFEGVTYEEAVDLDRNGNPVINSAYDYFDPPITRDRTRPVIRIIRNEISFSDSTILAYSDKVNSDTFYSYPPRTLKCGPPRGVQKYSQLANVNYFEVTYQLEYNPKTWKRRALNRGFRQLKTVSGSPVQVQIFDGQGQPIQDPYFLDSSGVALVPPVSSSNIVELAFDVYEDLDFTTNFAFPVGLLS